MSDFSDTFIDGEQMGFFYMISRHPKDKSLIRRVTGKREKLIAKEISRCYKDPSKADVRVRKVVEHYVNHAKTEKARLKLYKHNKSVKNAIHKYGVVFTSEFNEINESECELSIAQKVKLAIENIKAAKESVNYYKI